MSRSFGHEDVRGTTAAAAARSHGMLWRTCIGTLLMLLNLRLGRDRDGLRTVVDCVGHAGEDQVGHARTWKVVDSSSVLSLRLDIVAIYNSRVGNTAW